MLWSLKTIFAEIKTFFEVNNEKINFDYACLKSLFRTVWNIMAFLLWHGWVTLITCSLVYIIYQQFPSRTQTSHITAGKTSSTEVVQNVHLVSLHDSRGKIALRVNLPPKKGPTFLHLNNNKTCVLCRRLLLWMFMSLLQFKYVLHT